MQQMRALDHVYLAGLYEALARSYADLGWQDEQQQALEVAAAYRAAVLLGLHDEPPLMSAAEHDQLGAEHDWAQSTVWHECPLRRRHDDAHGEASSLHARIADELREALAGPACAVCDDTGWRRLGEREHACIYCPEPQE